MRRNRKISTQETRLHNLIAEECAKHGHCTSLFDLAVRVAGHEYHRAHNRLLRLEAMGYITVCRDKPPKPLVIVVANKQLSLHGGLE